MKIEDIRNYILECPYLDVNSIVGIDYLNQDVISYSITENQGYNPLVKTYINGDEERVFRFNLDAQLHWTEEIANNIANSNFFNNFSSWIKSQNDTRVFPSVEDGIQINKIITTTNGYILATNENEAIYRISCEISYTKNKTSNITSI